MAHHRLRLFSPAAEDAASGECERRTVTVPLETLFPLLGDASENQLAWLHDFGDDEVTISEDLYEIVRAYAALKAA